MVGDSLLHLRETLVQYVLILDILVSLIFVYYRPKLPQHKNFIPTRGCILKSRILITFSIIWIENKGFEKDFNIIGSFLIVFRFISLTLKYWIRSFYCILKTHSSIFQDIMTSLKKGFLCYFRCIQEHCRLTRRLDEQKGWVVYGKVRANSF